MYNKFKLFNMLSKELCKENKYLKCLRKLSHNCKLLNSNSYYCLYKWCNK